MGYCSAQPPSLWDPAPLLPHPSQDQSCKPTPFTPLPSLSVPSLDASSSRQPSQTTLSLREIAFPALKFFLAPASGLQKGGDQPVPLPQSS